MARDLTSWRPGQGKDRDSVIETKQNTRRLGYGSSGMCKAPGSIPSSANNTKMCATGNEKNTCKMEENICKYLYLQYLLLYLG
jgi:hypothetical protein